MRKRNTLQVKIMQYLFKTPLSKKPLPAGVNQSKTCRRDVHRGRVCAREIPVSVVLAEARRDKDASTLSY